VVAYKVKMCYVHVAHPEPRYAAIYLKVTIICGY